MQCLAAFVEIFLNDTFGEKTTNYQLINSYTSFTVRLSFVIGSLILYLFSKLFGVTLIEERLIIKGLFF